MKPQRGRPKNETPGGAVSAWVTTREQDRLIEIAREQRKSVSSVVRDAIRISLLEKSVSDANG